MENKPFEVWREGSEHENEKVKKALEQISHDDYLLNKKHEGNIDNAFDEDSLESHGSLALHTIRNPENGKQPEFEEEYPDYINEFSQDEEYQKLTGRIKMLELELIHGEGAFMTTQEVDQIKEEIKKMNQKQKDIITRSNLYREQMKSVDKKRKKRNYESN